MTCNKKSSPLDDGRTFGGFGELIPGLKLTDGTQNIPLGACATCAEWSTSELTSTERTRALQPNSQIRLGSVLSSLEFSMRRHGSQKPPICVTLPFVVSTFILLHNSIEPTRPLHKANKKEGHCCSVPAVDYMKSTLERFLLALACNVNPACCYFMPAWAPGWELFMSLSTFDEK